MAASFALLKARGPEDVGRTYRWRQALLLTGLAWFFLGFLGHLNWFVGRESGRDYLNQFLGPGALLNQTLTTATEFLVLGLGGWLFCMALAPRESLLVLPWLWSLSSGRWALRYLSTTEWHHVRYAAPIAALGLAAGLVGFGRLAVWLLRRRHGAVWLALVCVLTAAASFAAVRDLKGRMDRQPRAFTEAETREFWRWAGEVGPEDGVLAVYDLTAPFSSRRTLYSYILDMNKPKGYPLLPSSIRWVFYGKPDRTTENFETQGLRPCIGARA